MPAAGKHQACLRRSKIQHRLRRVGGVALHAPGHQHRQHRITIGDRRTDNLALIRTTGKNTDLSGKAAELSDTLRAANAHHFITLRQRVFGHILAKFARDTNDADFLHSLSPHFILPSLSIHKTHRNPLKLHHSYAYLHKHNEFKEGRLWTGAR